MPHLRAVAWGLIGAGVALRLWQYLSNASLWLDEAALARNVIDRSALELLAPLDYGQVAPAGFLLVEKAVTTALGTSEFALRLFPLACGIVAMPLFYRLARALLAPLAAVYALGLFALAVPLVYFSSQLKQYSSDLLATIVILLAAVAASKRGFTRRACVTLGAAGAVAVWFSQPAVLVLSGTAAVLAFDAVRSRRGERLVNVTLSLAMWAASAGAVVWLALRNVTGATAAYLDWFWTRGFMPVPPASWDAALWLWRTVSFMFGTFAWVLRRTNGGLAYPWSWIFVLAALAGLVLLVRRQRLQGWLLAAPLLVALAASAARVYPFSGRLLLYLLPIALLAVAAGADGLLRRWPARLQFATPAALAIFAGAPLYAIVTALPPERAEHLRPVLEYVEAHARPDDALYVYNTAGQAFLYYAPRLPSLTRRPYVVGQCAFGRPRVYFAEIDRLRAHGRVWFVATRASREFDAVVSYLEAIGTRVDGFTAGMAGQPVTEAVAFLYETAEAASGPTAETFDVPVVIADEDLRRLGCHGPQNAHRGGNESSAGALP